MRLIAKPDTWFKAGTEVFSSINDDKFTKEEIEEAKDYGALVAYGLRICESETELHKVGEEYWDGELCTLEEFDIIEE